MSRVKEGEGEWMEFVTDLNGGLLPLDVYELAENRPTAGHRVANFVGHQSER